MGKHWALVGLVWLSAVRDMTQLYSALIRESMQIDSALSQTAFCVTHRCPEQHAPRLNAVPDSMQLCSALSMTACAVWLRAVLDSMKLDTVLSLTACSLTQRCPRQHAAWLRIAFSFSLLSLDRAESRQNANILANFQKLAISLGHLTKYVAWDLSIQQFIWSFHHSVAWFFSKKQESCEL